MVRDKLKSFEYFENEITSAEKFIKKRKEKIIGLEEDIKNGINRFPKDNQSIICSTYQTSAMYEMEKY